MMNTRKEIEDEVVKFRLSSKYEIKAKKNEETVRTFKFRARQHGALTSMTLTTEGGNRLPRLLS